MDNLFVTFIIAYNLMILAYFLFLNSFYLVLLVLAAQKLWYHKRKIQTERLHGNFLPFIVKLDEEKKSKSLPSLAFIMPSYNEENTILESVNAISKIDYPYIDFVVCIDQEEFEDHTNTTQFFIRKDSSEFSTGTYDLSENFPSVEDFIKLIKSILE